LPISTVFEWDAQNTTTASVRRRAWKKLNKELFLSVLDTRTELIPSLSLQSREDIDQYTYNLIEAIQGAIDESTPWARPSQYAASFWTQECQEAVKESRKSRREFTKRPCLAT
jgi:hypothetical protein